MPLSLAAHLAKEVGGRPAQVDGPPASQSSRELLVRELALDGLEDDLTHGLAASLRTAAQPPVDLVGHVLHL